MSRVHLQHITHYRYDRLVRLSPQVVRLRPAPHARTPVHMYSLKVRPEKHTISWQQDDFANHLALLRFDEPVHELHLTVDLQAELVADSADEVVFYPHARPMPYDNAVALALWPFRQMTADWQPPASVAAWLQAQGLETLPDLPSLQRLTHSLATYIDYTVRHEPGVQTPEDTWHLRSGSCRDSAWLLVKLARAAGWAARFVSGYLIERTGAPAPGTVHPHLRDDSELHAWCEVYVPGAAWVGLDATSGLMTGTAHIPLACTPTPELAAPLEGTVEPCEVEFHHQMSLRWL